MHIGCLIDMKALFITPHFKFYKAIPSKVQLYQMAFYKKLTAVKHDDTKAIAPEQEMYIMQFMLRDPVMPNPFEKKSKVPVYEYIGMKNNYDRA